MNRVREGIVVCRTGAIFDRYSNRTVGWIVCEKKFRSGTIMLERAQVRYFAPEHMKTQRQRQGDKQASGGASQCDWS